MVSTRKLNPNEQKSEQLVTHKKMLNVTSNQNILTSTDSLVRSVLGAIQDSKFPHLKKEMMKLTYEDLFYKVYQKGARGGANTRIPN